MSQAVISDCSVTAVGSLAFFFFFSENTGPSFGQITGIFGLWTLDPGCWTLDAGLWMLGPG